MFNKAVFTRTTIVAAVSGLALSAALAQSNPPASPGNTEKAPMGTTAPNATPNTNQSTTGATGNESMAKAAPMIVSQQSPEQLLASKFKGTDVIGVDGKKIGDVADVLFEKDGRVSAYVIGIGGVLGIGEKQIAVDPASVELVPGKDAGTVEMKVAMNKDELSNATEFKPYSPPRPAAPTGGASSTAPMKPLNSR